METNIYSFTYNNVNEFPLSIFHDVFSNYSTNKDWPSIHSTWIGIRAGDEIQTSCMPRGKAYGKVGQAISFWCVIRLWLSAAHCMNNEDILWALCLLCLCVHRVRWKINLSCVELIKFLSKSYVMHNKQQHTYSRVDQYPSHSGAHH